VTMLDDLRMTISGRLVWLSRAVLPKAQRDEYDAMFSRVVDVAQKERIIPAETIEHVKASGRRIGVTEGKIP